MKEKDVEHGFLLKLERGEEVISTITDFCERRGIQSGVFNAIGALYNIEIGYYDLGKREYFFRNETAIFEVASMNGNITRVAEKPFIHAHAVLSRTDESCATIGGHIRKADVAVTLEVFLTPFNTPISRVMDDEVGLKLLHI